MDSSLLLDLLTALVALALLYGGAEVLLRGSADLGLMLRLSPLVVGLTIVAFATSAPELVVSVEATLRGAGDVAIGNVIGSNLANVGLILALSAIVYPLAVHRLSVRVDAPVMLGVSLVAALFLWDQTVGRIEAGLLLAALAGYMVFRVRLARGGKALPGDEIPPEPRWSPVVAIAAAVGGLLLLALGGDWLVRSGLSLAERFGVPEAFIALTLVAVGTSLPELATSMVAAFRKQADVAVGNVLGSNIFNLTCVLGGASMVRPLSGGDFRLELAGMLLLSFLLLPIAWTGFRLQRWEGALLLVLYLALIGWLGNAL
jgi:cation:H+ antiporter